MEFLDILRSSRFPSVGRWNKTVSKFRACLAWSRAFKASKCLEGYRDSCWTMKCDRNVRTTHLLAAWRSMVATPVVLARKIISWDHREAIHVFASQLSLLDGSLQTAKWTAILPVWLRQCWKLYTINSLEKRQQSSRIFSKKPRPPVAPVVGRHHCWLLRCQVVACGHVDALWFFVFNENVQVSGVQTTAFTCGPST